MSEPGVTNDLFKLALAGAAQMLVAVVGTSGLRLVTLGVLLGDAAPLLLRFIWFGLRLAFANDLAPIQR